MCFLSLIGLLPATAASVSAQLSTSSCPGSEAPDAKAETVAVARVTDGDTLVLADNRRVRLIGLNALELQTPYPHDRRWAETATKTLSDAIGTQPVVLVKGNEPLDRHGRTLAHVVVHSGDNAASVLVKNGLAIAVAIGRNTRCAAHLLALEQAARQAQIGIWAKPGNWFVDEPQLSGDERGFHVLQSKVQEVRGSKRKPTLVLSNGLTVKLGTVRLGQSDVSGVVAVSDLPGKRIEVRGWLSSSAGRVSLTLHNAANLRVLSN